MERRMQMFIEIDGSTPHGRYGGKVDGLSRLIGLGANVPRAVLIPAERIEAILPGGGVGGHTAAEAKSLLRDTAEQIWLDFAGRSVAVRSSAAGEDGATMSFAGQFETVLGVTTLDGLIVAMLDVLASASSERVTGYAQQMDHHADLRMSLIIQEMVHAEVSGVTFTRGARSAAGLTLVEASYGLGRAVVDGKVIPDQYWVSAQTETLVRSNPGRKKVRIDVGEDGGTETTSISPEHAEALCMSAGLAIDVAGLCNKLAEVVGERIDVEWATVGTMVYFLQMRPVTTALPFDDATSPYIAAVDPKIAARTLWTRMDIGEIFTGQLSPLGMSFAKYYQLNVHNACSRWTGARDYGDMRLHMGYMNNHVYLNVSYSAHIMSQMPHMRDLTLFAQRFSAPGIDLASNGNPFGLYEGAGRRTRSTAFFVATVAREIADSAARAKRMDQSRRHWFSRYRDLDLTTVRDHELPGLLDEALDYFEQMNGQYMPYYINAATFHGLLEELVGSWFPETGPAGLNRLKTDMSNLRTIASSDDLERMYERTASYPGVREALRTSSVLASLKGVRAAEGGPDFIERELTPFLTEHGVRGHEEMELSYPRWVDDPNVILEYLARRADGDGLGAGAARERREDEYVGGLDAKYASGLRGRLVQTVARLYKATSEQREVARMAMITSSWVVRRLFVEGARRQVEEGRLTSIEDLWCLNFDEIRRAMEGDVEVLPGAVEIARRREAWSAALKTPLPPQSFFGYWHPSMSATDVETDSSSLKGLPASPGIAIGRAHVITDLDRQIRSFRKGDVLVASYTDASWTPLIRDAAAVITDEGSYLSHSAIVTREFGIPCVVNTISGTSRISAGDVLSVDGDRGIVSLPGRDAEARDTGDVRDAHHA